MKAVLKYGQFTCMIEVADERPEIYILKPQDSPTYIGLSTPDLTKLTPSRLEFRYDKRLTDDIYLYTFLREV